MISRRTLLGSIFGAPLLMLTKDDSPKETIKLVSYPLALPFSQQRIEDIGDAFLSDLEHHFKDIRYTDRVVVAPYEGNSWGIAFIIPWGYAKKNIRTMLCEFAMPAIELIEHHNSKYQYYGVNIHRHSDGLAFWMAFTDVKEKPVDPNAAYSSWIRAI